MLLRGRMKFTLLTSKDPVKSNDASVALPDMQRTAVSFCVVLEALLARAVRLKANIIIFKFGCEYVHVLILVLGGAMKGWPESACSIWS